MTTEKLDINAAAEIVGLPSSIGDEFWGYGTEEATLGDHREVSACWADWVAFAGAVIRIDRMLAEQQHAAEAERVDRALTELARLDREAGLLDLDPGNVDRAIAEARKVSAGAQRVDERAVANAIWLAIRSDEDRCDMGLEDVPRDHPVWKSARAVVSLIARTTS